MEVVKTNRNLIAEIAELRSRLEEAQDTIDAIRSGEVDAFIVKNGDDHELYTLKSADQTYRIFIEKMAEGAITINREGIILYSNTSFANMLGLSLAHVIGCPFDDFIPDEYKNKLQQLIKQGWNEEKKVEITLPGKNKNTIPVLISFNSLEIDGGTALSIIVSDLSYQKQTQQQLKQKNKELEEAQLIARDLNTQLEQTVKERTNELFESREHFKFLADNIPTIVWITGANGDIDFVNKRWTEYVGSAKTNTGNEMHSFIHATDKEEYVSLWKKAVDSGQPFESVHRFKKNDGDYRWHYSQALPFKNNSNEIVAWFGISTDIDDQQRAIEKKDEFISIASHELKTPVTSIKGYVQVLRFNFLKEGNTAAAELLTKVDAQINKLTTLIADLLDVRKIENGQLSYHEADFNFNDLVNEIVEETGRTLLHHDIICEPGKTGIIKGDRNKIGQVISNFIDNAAKYSPHNTNIFVRTIKDGNKIKLLVQDSGIGIPKDQQTKVFERFFRVSGEKENTYAGLGLGLYISSEIIKWHEGIIGVESEKDKGSTFYFELLTVD